MKKEDFINQFDAGAYTGVGMGTIGAHFIGIEPWWILATVFFVLSFVVYYLSYEEKP